MLNQLLKNRIIWRIIDLSCHIISLENAAEFPIFCRTLSEALSVVEYDFSVLFLLFFVIFSRASLAQEKFRIPKLGNSCKFSQFRDNIGEKLGKFWEVKPPLRPQKWDFLGKI